MEPKKQTSRRKFLSMGFTAGTTLHSAVPDTKPTDSLRAGDTRLLLTPDGKLVEVKSDVVDQAKQGKKASNLEILKWSRPAL